jgi:hypothetical protein
VAVRTHVALEKARVAREVGAQGQLVALQLTDERGEVIARPRRAALEWLRARPEVDEAEVFGERIHLAMRKIPDLDAVESGLLLGAGLRTAGVEVESVREIPPSLEDVFIGRIRREQTDISQEQA